MHSHNQNSSGCTSESHNFITQHRQGLHFFPVKASPFLPLTQLCIFEKQPFLNYSFFATSFGPTSFFIEIKNK